MELEFRKGTSCDLDGVFDFVKASVWKMESENIFQWDEFYPTKEDFAEDINRGELSVGFAEGKAVCVYVINSQSDEAYDDAGWNAPESEYRVLHRIVVNPEFQGRGVGRRTMLHIFDELKSQGVESLRLDVFSGNPWSLKLYEGLGFVMVGEANWRKGLFYLMEKIL